VHALLAATSAMWALGWQQWPVPDLSPPLRTAGVIPTVTLLPSILIHGSPQPLPCCAGAGRDAR